MAKAWCRSPLILDVGPIMWSATQRQYRVGYLQANSFLCLHCLAAVSIVSSSNPVSMCRKVVGSCQINVHAGANIVSPAWVQRSAETGCQEECLRFSWDSWRHFLAMHRKDLMSLDFRSDLCCTSQGQAAEIEKHLNAQASNGPQIRSETPEVILHQCGL